MREIKFRAWNKITKTMLKVMAIYWGSNPIVLTAYKFFEDWHIGMPSVTEEYREENYILMQYTGLKDKNGKEIFEGDIVICPRLDPVIRTVKYVDNRGGFYFVSESYYASAEFISDCEIIGNIYESKI